MANDTDVQGRYFNLMLEYFGVDEVETPSVCYALYNGSATAMDASS